MAPRSLQIVKEGLAKKLFFSSIDGATIAANREGGAGQKVVFLPIDGATIAANREGGAGQEN